MENYTKNIINLTSEITHSERNDTILQKESDIFTEQEFRVIQIRNAMSACIENKNVFPLNLDKKEHFQTILFENNLNVNSPPNVNLSTKIGNNESLPDLKPEHKSKTDSNRSRSSSSKASSRSFSNSLTSSYARGTYLSVIEKQKTTEQAKLLALQTKKNTQNTTFRKRLRA